jgi:hypothetical protein
MATDGTDPIVTEARERWIRADSAEEKQRESILAAKDFRAGNQWDQAIKTQREGGNSLSGQAQQPARPCLTIDRISQPVRQASNAVKQANISIDVKPNGEHANDETATVFTGYLRRMQNQARGDAPIEWAADSAIESGLGWLRMRSVYCSDEVSSDISAFDQEMVLERITNSLSIYCDPSSEKPTKSDAQWMIQTEDLSLDEFKRRWPKAQQVGVEDVVGDTSNWKDWVRDDMIRIADYWRIVYETQHLCLLNDGRVVPLEQAPDKKAIVQTRVVEVPKVECYKINAMEVLEPKGVWLGRRIPLFPIIGEELNVDGRKVYRGIIQSAMDAQRMVNYLYSGAVETAALAPKAPWIIAEGQDEGHPEWQHANTYNYQALYYKPVTLGGDMAPPPKRNIEEPPIQAMVELLHLSEEAIKATTAFFDASLGNHNSNVTSGRQTIALQKQQEQATSNFLDNVVRTMIEIGNEAVYIIPKITRKGQLLHILGLDDKPEQVIAGQQFMQGQNGQAQPITPEQAPMLEKGMAKFFDLTAGRYGVTVDVGKSATTMREEGLGALGELIPHLPPEMAAVITPEFVAEMSFPGAQRMAEILRKALPPQLQQQEEGGPDPKLQQAMQQIQMLTEQIKSKAAEKQAEMQAKGQLDMQKQQLEGQQKLQLATLEQQGKERLAWIQQSAQIAIAGAKIDAEQARTFVDAVEQRSGKALDLHMEHLGHAQDALHATAQMTHEQGQTDLQHAHEIAMAQIEHQHAMDEAQQGQQHALEQGQQAADLAPEPAAGTNDQG